MSLATILFETLRSLDPIAATIARGSGSCSASIVLGRTDATAITTREAVIEADAQDFLILAADYAPSGTATDPRDADTISYVSPSGKTVIAEVRPPSAAAQAFNTWRGDEVIRVHTKITSRT